MPDLALRLVDAFLFLLVGMAAWLLVLRTVYPRLKWAFERAKMTGSQGIDPGYYVDALRPLLLVGLPLIGFVAGPHWLGSWVH
ncbi:MAG: hypothetical protein U1E46_08485 [Hyphomicrobiales bacterium]